MKLALSHLHTLAIAMSMFGSIGCQHPGDPAAAPPAERKKQETSAPTVTRDATVGQPADAEAAKHDAELIAAIERALKNGAEPETVETLVGTPATLNTSREEDRASFEFVDLGAAPDAKPFLPP